MRLLSVLVIGSLISSIGSGMTAFALATWAFTTFGTASSVAMIELCALAPIVLLSPLAGVLADRHDRRTMMLLGDGGSALGLATVLIAVTRPEPSLLLVLAGVTVSSCLAALTEPALRATVNELVPAELYTRASSMLQMASSSKFLLSPFLAGALMPRIGVAGVLLIDASTFVVTLICTLHVRRRATSPAIAADPGSLVAQLRATAALLHRDAPVRTVVLLGSLLTVVLGTLQVLLPPVLLPLYPVSQVGTVQSVAAFGMLAGALIVGLLGKVPSWALLATGLAGLGASMALFPLMHSLVGVGACCFVVFASLAWCNTGADVVVRTRVADDHQGRAWGLISLITQTGFLLAYAASGPLADHVFEPLLRPDGPLVELLGSAIGIGEGRGTTLLIALCGAGAIALIPISMSRGLREIRPARESDDAEEPALQPAAAH